MNSILSPEPSDGRDEGALCEALHNASTVRSCHSVIVRFVSAGVHSAISIHSVVWKVDSGGRGAHAGHCVEGAEPRLVKFVSPVGERRAWTVTRVALRDTYASNDDR